MQLDEPCMRRWVANCTLTGHGWVLQDCVMVGAGQERPPLRPHRRVNNFHAPANTIISTCQEMAHSLLCRHADDQPLGLGPATAVLTAGGPSCVLPEAVNRAWLRVAVLGDHCVRARCSAVLRMGGDRECLRCRSAAARLIAGTPCSVGPFAVNRARVTVARFCDLCWGTGGAAMLGCRLHGQRFGLGPTPAGLSTGPEGSVAGHAVDRDRARFESAHGSVRGRARSATISWRCVDDRRACLHTLVALRGWWWRRKMAAERAAAEGTT